MMKWISGWVGWMLTFAAMVAICMITETDPAYTVLGIYLADKWRIKPET